MDKGDILYQGLCPAVREIIHSLKLEQFLLEQVDKPWYNLSSWIISSYRWTNHGVIGVGKFRILGGEGGQGGANS